jgi:hypothetical protein
MKRGEITLTPAIIIGMLGLILSVSISMTGAAYMVGGSNRDVEDLKIEQLAIREEIKVLPAINMDLWWIKEQLSKIQEHLGAEKVAKH